MPAVSQQQQKLFGLALSVKRGETPRSEASEEVLNIVDSMSEKDIKDFAETSHSGLPSKVEQQIREALRELMREMAIQEAELPQATIPANIKTKLVQAIDKIKDTNLNYNQKLQVIGKVIDSLGIDKKELSKMSSKLKTTLESLNEEDPCWKGYQQIGMKTKDGKEVPNCVPESIQEGKKRFRQQDGIGKAKYTISYHDGKQKHKDGSDFFGIQIFKNKKDLETFRNALLKKGFVEESINEAASRTAVEIGGLTGMSKDFIQKFVDTHNLDIEKVFQFVKKGNLKDRMDFVTGLAGKPNNPYQTKLIKMFGESVNEGQLNVGDTIKVQAGNTLQKMNTLDDKWKVIKKDNSTYTLKKVGSGMKVRHYQTKVDYLIARPGQSQLPFVVESVNEDTKKRFEVDFYKGNGDRQTSHEEIIRGDKFSDIVSQATKIAKSKGMNYVEFYYKDAFIGSIDKRNNYTFKKGRNSEKSPLSVNEDYNQTQNEI